MLESLPTTAHLLMSKKCMIQLCIMEMVVPPVQRMVKEVKVKIQTLKVKTKTKTKTKVKTKTPRVKTKTHRVKIKTPKVKIKTPKVKTKTKTRVKVLNREEDSNKIILILKEVNNKSIQLMDQDNKILMHNIQMVNMELMVNTELMVNMDKMVKKDIMVI